VRTTAVAGSGSTAISAGASVTAGVGKTGSSSSSTKESRTAETKDITEPRPSQAENESMPDSGPPSSSSSKTKAREPTGEDTNKQNRIRSKTPDHVMLQRELKSRIDGMIQARIPWQRRLVYDSHDYKYLEKRLCQDLSKILADHREKQQKHMVTPEWAEDVRRELVDIWFNKFWKADELLYYHDVELKKAHEETIRATRAEMNMNKPPSVATTTSAAESQEEDKRPGSAQGKDPVTFSSSVKSTRPSSDSAASPSIPNQSGGSPRGGRAPWTDKQTAAPQLRAERGDKWDHYGRGYCTSCKMNGHTIENCKWQQPATDHQYGQGKADKWRPRWTDDQSSKAAAATRQPPTSRDESNTRSRSWPI
jgi:hypothetical protein